MDLDLISWDATTRGVLFAATFLVPLLAVLWVWFDGSGSTESRRWAWRLPLAVAVLLTVPALVLGAASVDPDEALLLDRLGLLAFGAAAVALVGTVAYATAGRPDAPVVERAAGGAADPWARVDIAAGGGGSFAADAPSFDSTLGSARVAAGDGVFDPTPAKVAEAPAGPAPEDVRAVIVIKSGPDKGRQVPIAGGATLGRDPDATVSLVDSRVSTRHAEIRSNDDGYVFLDLASTNGSYLIVEGREERIRHPQRLVDGDEIRIGKTIVQFIQVPGGKVS